MRVLAALLTAALCVHCGAPAPSPLTHQAYVWQRSWTAPVSAAVAGAPAELTGLRVLTLELDASGTPVWPPVDVAALARSTRPITAVIRIDGPIALSKRERERASVEGQTPVPDHLLIDDVRARLAAWQTAGVTVDGIEIDHDCATAALPDYAAWLVRNRPPAPLRFSITALPTWAESPAALRRLAATVDELVVQVHAIQAPQLFEPAQARRWLETFAAAAPTAQLRVALPTYRVNLAGRSQAAEPTAVASLLRSLERSPIPGLTGVVWFRLPVAGDTRAWTAATLRRVIHGDSPAAPAASARTPHVAVELLERRPGVVDVILTNAGPDPAPFPPIALAGTLAAADLIGGYRASSGDLRTWSPPARDVPPGARTVVGWATGKDLRAHVP